MTLTILHMLTACISIMGCACACTSSSYRGDAHAHVHRGGIPPFTKYDSHLLYMNLINNFLLKQTYRAGKV